MRKVEYFSFAVDVIVIPFVIILYCFKAFVPIWLGSNNNIRVLFNCSILQWSLIDKSIEYFNKHLQFYLDCHPRKSMIKLKLKSG